MKKAILLAGILVCLAYPSGPLFAEGWTSKTSPNQRVGPKFGDYLKKKASDPVSKKGKKKPADPKAGG